MSPKKLILIGIFVGGFVGSLIPTLWGESSMSFSSIILSTLGSLFGIYLGYKVSKMV